MSRLICSPAKVCCNITGQPIEIWFQQTSARVEKILDCWMDTGCWWEGESEKVFYRLCCDEGRVYEVYQDLVSRQWAIYKAYD